MYDFTYHKPKTVAEAAALLAKESDAKLLAGGHTLIPTMKQRLASPSDLVDLGGVAELKGISVSGGTVSIGANATLYKNLQSATLADYGPNVVIA